MKLGYIEVSGIRRIVEGQKVVWERYPDRWVKFIDKKQAVGGFKKKSAKTERRAITGMSDSEMHDYLDDKIFDCVFRVVNGERYPFAKNRVWVHGDTINIVRAA